MRPSARHGPLSPAASGQTHSTKCRDQTSKRLDAVGVCFFSLITATGGGTLRDLLIGAPVFWMHNAAPVFLCLGVGLLAYAVPTRRWPERTLEWFDGVGLAAYAVYSADKALQFGVPPLPAAVTGIITACVGGIIRDIAAGVPSVLLRHELYVTAAAVAAGTFVFLTLVGVAGPWPALIGAFAGFMLRAAAIRWKFTLKPHRG